MAVVIAADPADVTGTRIEPRRVDTDERPRVSHQQPRGGPVSVMPGLSLATINADARQVHLLRALATLIAGVLYGVGWVLGVVWFVLVWCFLAVKVGWVEARPREGD